ncbi:chemotaxis protein CheW [Caulobacter segnis]
MSGDQGARRRLTVRAAGARMSLPAQAVAEVIKRPRLTRVPHAPPGLLGVAHLRGTVLPVVSLGHMLGLDGADGDRVVVLRRDPPVGLVVDGVEALAFADDEAEDGDTRLRLSRADGTPWLDLDEALNAKFATDQSRRRAASVVVEAAQATLAHVGEPDLAFLGFTLAGQTYGLPLDAIVEVAAVPKVIAELPRTEAVLLGVCDYRGQVLPVLSARGLLGLAGDTVNGRLVVVRISGERIGLVVDEVNAIVRASADRLGKAPSLFNRGGGEARIDAVLRLADGRGVLAILTPDRLLADERVTQWLALASGSKEAEMVEIRQAAIRERFVILRLGDECYGLPIAAVDEIVRAPDQFTRLPKAPAYVRGVMNLRGKTLPVIDQRLRFSAPGEPAANGRVIVVTVDGLQAGFAVDGASEIVEIGADELLPAPELSGDHVRLFDRAVERGGEVILLVDPKTLLARAEADLLRDLTRALPAS